MQTSRRIDAMDVEHIGSLVTGGLIFVKGLATGGALGALYKIGGLALVFRGQQGYGRLHNALGRSLPERASGVGTQNNKVESVVVVHRSAEELYRIWRHLSNLPVFMSYLEEVVEVDDVKSKWTTKAPLGMVVRWDAKIINDIPGQVIAWQSLEGSGVDNAGAVRFETLDDGSTALKVTLRYDPPADIGGYAVAKLFGMDAQKQIDEDLHRFKHMMEVKGIDGEYAINP